MLPSHQGGKIFTNHQAKPGSSESARIGTFDLAEGLKQILLILFGNPDAGVFDRDLDVDMIEMFIFEVNLDDYSPLIGKFDGIANQI